MLIVLVGARGAGKTTLQETLRSEGVTILQPSTTRSRRSSEEAEYDFVAGNWVKELYAWDILVGNETYGMRKAELLKAANGLCVTVFDPINLEVFEQMRREFPFETMTIGLDSIEDLNAQSDRVENSSSRIMDQRSFSKAQEVVKTCDIVLSGDAELVASAVRACIDIINGRGGVITKNYLMPLIAAGSVLSNADSSKIRPASYDLRIGNEVWCQGQLRQLTEESPRFQIPAYSYAIVSALETAKLPPFMIGRFDLKVGFFFEGIILSNGPQIDPGYKGALFCMLYNGSGRPKLITRGRQFATIDFTTTTTVTEGYKQRYQFQERMERFMTDEALMGRGGEIVDLINAKVAIVDRKLKNINLSFWAIAGAVIAISVAFPAIGVPVIWTELVSLHSEKEAIEDSQREEARLLDVARRENEEALNLLQKSVNQVTHHGASKVGARANPGTSHVN